MEIMTDLELCNEKRYFYGSKFTNAEVELINSESQDILSEDFVNIVSGITGI